MKNQRVIAKYGYRFALDFDTNRICKSLELIGIYNLYNDNRKNEEFSNYYQRLMQTPHFKYRYLGIDTIYKLLDLDDLPYNISKKSIRRTGICFSTSRVYEGTDVLVKKIIEYIKGHKDLYDFYCRLTHIENVEEYLTFQYHTIVDYVAQHYGNNARCFSMMKDNIEELIKGVYHE